MSDSIKLLMQDRERSSPRFDDMQFTCHLLVNVLTNFCRLKEIQKHV